MATDGHVRLWFVTGFISRIHRRAAVAGLLALALGYSALTAAPPATQPGRATRPSGAASRPADPPLPVDSRQEASLLRLMGSDFQIRRTPHFLLAYNTNPGIVDELASRMEDTYRAVYRFAGVVGIEASRPSQRLEVIFFNRRDEYEKYCAQINFPPQGTYGVYYEPTNRSAFFNVYNDPTLLELQSQIAAARENLADLTDTLKGIRGNQPVILSYGDGRQERLSKKQVQKRLEENGRKLRSLDNRRANYSEWINHTIIQHETAHQVLFNAGVHRRRGANPKWVVEGLACLFETPPGEWGSGIAATNQLRLKDFRAALAGPKGKTYLNVNDFLNGVHEERTVSPERLVSDPLIFFEREEHGANAYAMAWSLTHYLQRRQPRQLAAYLKEIAARRQGQEFSSEEETAVFERFFGKLDDAFLKQWGTHTLQLAYRPPIGF